MKRNVYLAQPNHTYGRNAFLPYSAGLLQATAMVSVKLTDAYEFQPIIFRREDIEKVIARMKAKPPDVLGLSCYIWNFEYNMALAQAVRAAFPDCLIVAGGPHVPIKHDIGCPAVDICVNYEGELMFAAILTEHLASGRADQQITVNSDPKDARVDDLSVLQSPYLTGIFDQILKDNPDLDFHATQETHRGCPYSCTFCDWGSAVFTKLRKFDDQRILKEITWMADHKIEMLYNADANYGIFPRDLELTKRMANINKIAGYPKKFRAAYAKNSNDTIFEHAKILHGAGMNKGVTLSFQSMDKETLKTVKRDNIKVTDFSRLMAKYKEAGIATYSEIILGLPGETYDSFADGIDTLISCGQHDSLQIYTCEVLPNSEMANPHYRVTHGIETVKSPIPMFHGTPSVDPHQEYYRLVTKTKTMPPTEWMRAQIFAWAVQAFHCLGVTQQIAVALNYTMGISYRSFYEKLISGIQESAKGALPKIMRQAVDDFANLRDGKPWGEYNPLFGDIVWPPEEAAFLKMVSQKPGVYEEIWDIVVEKIAPQESVDFLEDLFEYQMSVTADPEGCSFKLSTRYDWKAFFDGKSKVPEITKKWFRVEPVIDCKSDVEMFAREIVWYGRKGGSFRNKVEYA